MSFFDIALLAPFASVAPSSDYDYDNDYDYDQTPHCPCIRSFRQAMADSGTLWPESLP